MDQLKLKQHSFQSDNLRLIEGTLPDWLSDTAKMYLEHTENGVSLRSLARQSGQHASTVMRNVRKYEAKRDDPLIDEAFRRFGSVFNPCQRDNRQGAKMSYLQSIEPANAVAIPLNAKGLEDKAKPVLGRLCESGTVLALAKDLDNAVIVRDGPEGTTERLAVVDRSIAMALAMQDWIATDNPDLRIVRYKLTALGRAKLRDLVDQDPEYFEQEKERRAQSKSFPNPRFGQAESPLMQLARRRDKKGQPFLQDHLVTAGERMREDFELAVLDRKDELLWSRAITGDWCIDSPQIPTDIALKRVTDALAHLGPGLGDIALRSCCMLEGMEAVEHALGWSARSGKIVLRIALQRLANFYRDNPNYTPLIG